MLTGLFKTECYWELRIGSLGLVDSINGKVTSSHVWEGQVKARERQVSKVGFPISIRKVGSSQSG